MTEPLGYNKVAKKQKFSPLDIVELQSKEMRSPSYHWNCGFGHIYWRNP